MFVDTFNSIFDLANETYGSDSSKCIYITPSRSGYIELAAAM